MSYVMVLSKKFTWYIMVAKEDYMSIISRQSEKPPEPQHESGVNVAGRVLIGVAFLVVGVALLSMSHVAITPVHGILSAHLISPATLQGLNIVPAVVNTLGQSVVIHGMGSFIAGSCCMILGTGAIAMKQQIRHEGMHGKVHRNPYRKHQRMRLSMSDVPSRITLEKDRAHGRWRAYSHP